MPPTPRAKRCTQGDESSTTDREHWPYGSVQIVRDAGSLIYSQKPHTRVTPNGAFFPWQGDDTGTVLKGERQGGLALGRDGFICCAVKAQALLEEFLGLPERRREQQDQGTGFVECGVDSQQADHS